MFKAPPLANRGTFAHRRWLVAVCVAVVSTPLLGAPQSDTRVADAAMRADTQAIRSLLQSGADVNGAQGDGMTALHWAVMKDDGELARMLLQAGARATSATRLGAYTPLLLAAANGNAALLELLLRAGADSNSSTSNGTTALMLAAASGREDAVKLLLDRGADPNRRENARGETALMYAAADNRPAVTRLLIERGADPSIATIVVDLSKVDAPRPALNADRQDTNRELIGTQGGMTALLFAARQGNTETVKALLDAGVDVNQVNPGDKTSPLLIAAINGHFDLAALLLDRGANPNLASTAGATPLYATLNLQWIPRSQYPQPTAHTQQKTTYLDLMTKLLQHGADPNARLTRKLWYTGYNFEHSGVDENGATAFWRAAQATDLAAMRLLVKSGADPTISPEVAGRRRRAPAESRATSPNPAVVPRSGGAPSAVPRAANGDNEAPVNALLVAVGAGWFGNFHVNAPGSWMPAVKYLVEELGFDVNAADFRGYTALHYAAARGDDEMIVYLVSKGADVKAEGKDGVTVADMANGHDARVQPFLDTIALLEKLGSRNNHNCLSCGRPR